jgi:hypothetical protein
MGRRVQVAALLLTLGWVAVAFAHGVPEAQRQAMVSGGSIRYIWLGATHMLTGYDHLLFLLGVIFFLTRFSEVIKCVTAFTLGHSITLLGATLLGISLNYFLIDAMIALSVCYKGFENTDGFRRHLDMAPPPMLTMIFVFGLIHGFGLSTRLQQLPLGDRGLVLRILSFNLGVEIGQILALLVMVVILRNWRKTESFGRFSIGANHGLVAAGLLLFLVQMHGFGHAVFPNEFGFNQDAHYHAHQHMEARQAPEKTLPVVDAATTRALLPFLANGATRELVIEKLGRAWKFQDDSGKILAYGVALAPDPLVVRGPDDGTAPYDLVLVFDEQGRLKEHTLVKNE